MMNPKMNLLLGTYSTVDRTLNDGHTTKVQLNDGVRFLNEQLVELLPGAQFKFVFDMAPSAEHRLTHLVLVVPSEEMYRSLSGSTLVHHLDMLLIVEGTKRVIVAKSRFGGGGSNHDTLGDMEYELNVKLFDQLSV